MIGSDYKKYVVVGEHTIKMPPCPKNKEDVFFVNEKDAFWRRDLIIKKYKQIWFDFIPFHTKVYQDGTHYDQDDILVSLNKEDSDYIIRTYQEEMKRRTEGVFAKIKNEIVWFPGDYWFVLMYCRTKRPDKKDFFDFRRFQLHDSYLCHHADISPLIGGLNISKTKKTGITNLRWLYILNRSTKTKNSNYGNMNLSQDQGAKTFRDHFMYAYNGLLPVWKAQIKNKSDNDGKVIFGKKYSSSKKSIILSDTEDELNTTVMCVPTKNHAFDVDVFDVTWYDEPPKYDSDFGEIYRSNNSGTSIQDIMVGKIWLTSYTPEENSPSFLSAKELYYDSKLSTASAGSNGQTKSKLICHHIPSYASWTSAFDKYGDCDEIEANKRIDFGRQQLKDRPRELQAETRKYAKTEREAWAAGGVGSVFDNIRLSELLVDVEEEERNSPVPPYTEGRLLWTNELWNINPNLRRKGEFGPVKFVPLTPDEMARKDIGRLREYFPLPQKQQNLALKQGRDEWNCLIAPQVFANILGADPTQHAAASEVVQGSKNSFHVKSRTNPAVDAQYGKIATGFMFMEYFYRPETPDEAFDDLLKLIIYTGSLCAVEANAPYCATRLMEEGLGNYMLVKDKSGIMQIWKRHMGLPHEEEKEYSLLRATATAQNKTELESFVRLIKAILAKQPPGNPSYGEMIKSSRLLNQLMNLDIKDTKVFDLFMSYGWMELCDEVYSNILLNLGGGDMEHDQIAAVLRALRPAI
jgi:hypothetical protein